MRPAVFALLAVAALSAPLLGRAHRPVSVALWLSLASAVLAASPLPRAALLVVALVPPVITAGAAWGALRSARAWLLASAASVAVLGLPLVGLGLDRHELGRAYAAVWLGALLVGGAACYRARAPRSTRFVVVALLAGLAPEAVAWLAWGADVDGGYSIVRAASLASLVVVVVIQLVEARRRWIDSTPMSSPPASQA